jgi:hypothetical protein
LKIFKLSLPRFKIYLNWKMYKMTDHRSSVNKRDGIFVI